MNIKIRPKHFESRHPHIEQAAARKHLISNLVVYGFLLVLLGLIWIPMVMVFVGQL